MNRFVAKVQSSIERYGMLSEGDRAGIALSGGADSVALLTALCELAPERGFCLVAIHVNHGLRGDESDRDATFVEDLVGSFSLPLEKITLEPGLLTGSKSRPSLEDRARRERYRIFEQVCRDHDLAKIALGHTRDDQAETVLMKFLRGSGLAGLRGMLPVRDGVYIRPLLEVTRAEVMAYLEQKGLAHVTDSSNANEGYLRNKIRHSVIPFLGDACNTNLKATLARTAHILRDEEDLLSQIAAEERRKLALEDNGRLVELDLGKFRSAHRALQRRIIRDILEAPSFHSKERGFEHVEAVLELARGHRPSTAIDLGCGLQAWREYDRLFLGVPARDDGQRMTGGFSYPAQFPGTTSIDALSRILSLEIVHVSEVRLADNPKVVYMNADALDGRLRVRSIQPGDRIQPLGMKGRKKIKDIFIDARVPRRLRQSVPLLVDDRSVLWVFGHCVSERVRVSEDSEAVVKAEIV